MIEMFTHMCNSSKQPNSMSLFSLHGVGSKLNEHVLLQGQVKIINVCGHTFDMGVSNVKFDPFVQQKTTTTILKMAHSSAQIALSGVEFMCNMNFLRLLFASTLWSARVLPVQTFSSLIIPIVGKLHWLRKEPEVTERLDGGMTSSLLFSC